MNEMASIGAHGIERNSTYIHELNNNACVESLLKNESDFIQSFIPYGRQDFDRIYPVFLWREIKMSIHSAYNRTSSDSKHYANIGKSALTGLGWGVVSTTIALLLFSYLLVNGAVFVKLVRMRRRTLRFRQYRWRFGFGVFSLFMRQGSLNCSNRINLSLVSLLISLISFYVLVSISNVLTTELVVIDQPHLISDYDKITQNPVMKVATAEAFSTDDLMMSSGPESRNGRFWQAVENRTFPLIMESTSLDDLLTILDDAIQHRVIALLPKMFDNGIHKTICKLYPLAEEKLKGAMAFHYFTQDPETEGIPMSMVITQSFRKTETGKKFIVNWRRAAESGLADKIVSFIDIAAIVPANLPQGDYYRTCMYGGRIIMPDVPNTQSVKPENMVSIFVSFVGSCCFIFLILILERFSFRFRRRDIPDRNSEWRVIRPPFIDYRKNPREV